MFFEGPVRTGKSTALRQVLLPYLSDLGGFVVQRLTNPDGVPMAYRLVGLDEIRQTGKDAEAMFLAVDAPYSGSDSDVSTNIFLRVAPRSFDANVFATYGVECLQASVKNSLILLDEIGGVDLLSTRFRELLHATLNGSTPCVGVVKELEKARDAQSFNRELRTLLTIHQISSEDLSSMDSIVQSFIVSQTS